MLPFGRRRPGSSVASGQGLPCRRQHHPPWISPIEAVAAAARAIPYRKNGTVKLWVKRGGMAILPGPGLLAQPPGRSIGRA